MKDLIERSIAIIKKYQSENGAFVASPSFETYNFCWLRDGSYVAHSMDVWGEYEASGKFYQWVNGVIERYGKKVDKIATKLQAGQALDKKDFLYARYTLEGYEEKEDGWGNFQLDGYGTWLWGLAEHIKLTGKTELIEKYEYSIQTSIKYIENLWYYPNYDLWEENFDKNHSSTLACLYGGLKEINYYLKNSNVEALYNRIRTYILTNCANENSFIKFIGNSEVDSSLLWMAVPFGVVDTNDEIMVNTAAKIEGELLHNGGMHRYKKDTYYGGGEWIILSAWMGLYYCDRGKFEKAQGIVKWIEKQATEEGCLTEQVCNHVNDEVYYPYWVEKWGKPACPLLWSHAMYLILKKRLA